MLLDTDSESCLKLYYMGLHNDKICSEKMNLFLKQSDELSTIDCMPCIVECICKPMELEDHYECTVVRVRHDKTISNFETTVLKTLQSISENINLKDIYQICRWNEHSMTLLHLLHTWCMAYSGDTHLMMERGTEKEVWTFHTTKIVFTSLKSLGVRRRRTWE